MMLCADTMSRPRLPGAPDAPATDLAACLAGAPAWGTRAPPPAAPLLVPPSPPDEEEQAVSRRPVPTEAAPAMRRARIASWRARAPMARNVLLMHLGRSARAVRFRDSRNGTAPLPMRCLSGSRCQDVRMS